MGADRNQCFGNSVWVKRKEKPIGVIDLHNAVHARSAGLTLVTNNLAEFERVPGLLMENWLVGT